MSKFSDQYKAQLAQQASHSNVDQAPQSEAAQQAIQSGQYIPGDTSAFTEAVGSGLMRGFRGAGNLIMSLGGYGPPGDPETKELADFKKRMPVIGDDAIREQEKIDKPLMSQPGASTGRFLGEAASVPGVGEVGAGARSTLSKAPSVLARTLGERAPQRALEGATSAAQFADPNQVGEAGLTGTALSLALGRMGDSGGRLLNGLVKKSDAAQHLEHLASQHGEDIHIPLSLSADTDDPISALAAGVYRNVSPIVPLMSNRLEKQRDAARKLLRKMAFGEATPNGVTLTDAELSDSDTVLRKLSDEFSKKYDSTVKSYAFNVPKDFDQQVTAKIKAARPNIDSTTLNDTTGKMQEIIDRFSDSKGQISGDNLLYAKREIGELIKGGKLHEKDAYKAGAQWIDDHIVNELSQGGAPSNLVDLKEYLDLSSPWKSKVAVDKAARTAKSGDFGPEQLYRSSRPFTDTRALGKAGSEVLGPKATQGGVQGKVLASLGLAGTGAGVYMAPAATAAMLAGGHLLANKSTQRALTGDTAAQRYVIEMLRKNPQLQEVLSAARRGTTAEAGDEFNGP